MTRAVRDFLTNLDSTGALEAGGTIVAYTHADAQHIAQNLREGAGLAARRRWRILSVGSVSQCVKLSGLNKPVLLAPSISCAPDAVRDSILAMVQSAAWASGAGRAAA